MQPGDGVDGGEVGGGDGADVADDVAAPSPAGPVPGGGHLLAQAGDVVGAQGARYADQVYVVFVVVLVVFVVGGTFSARLVLF